MGGEEGFLVCLIWEEAHRKTDPGSGTLVAESRKWTGGVAPGCQPQKTDVHGSSAGGRTDEVEALSVAAWRGEDSAAAACLPDSPVARERVSSSERRRSAFRVLRENDGIFNFLSLLMMVTGEIASLDLTLYF